MNNNTESGKTASHPVGHGAPISSIHTVKLIASGENTTVHFTSSEDGGFDLPLNETITLENPIGSNHPFVIQVAVEGAAPVPPVQMVLDTNQTVVLTEEAEDYGWKCERTSLFGIEGHGFGPTVIIFGGPGPEPAEQEIIIVGTVPTPGNHNG